MTSEQIEKAFKEAARRDYCQGCPEGCDVREWERGKNEECWHIEDVFSELLQPRMIDGKMVAVALVEVKQREFKEPQDGGPYFAPKNQKEYFIRYVFQPEEKMTNTNGQIEEVREKLTHLLRMFIKNQENLDYVLDRITEGNAAREEAARREEREKFFQQITSVEHTQDFSLTTVFGRTDRQTGYISGWRDFAKDLRRSLSDKEAGR